MITHPVRIATEFIEENFTGTLPVEVMLTAAPDTFKDPEVLAKVDRLQQFIAS